MIKAYHRASEFQDGVLESRGAILERGIDVGFHSAKDLFNLKIGYTSFIYAFPFQGKTSLIFDILMTICKRDDIKVACFSPEGGSKESLVTYLCQVYMSKKMHGKNSGVATDEEWLKALDFIDSHFVILDPKLVGKDKVEFTTTELFSQVHRAEQDYGFKISVILIDPYNMLSKTKEERSKTIADYVLENLTYVNHVARSMNVHIMVAMHLRDEEMVVDKESGVEYFRKPHPSKIAGGTSVYRVMQMGVGIWRCPEGVKDIHGVEYPENATEVLIQKNKIQGAGTTGSMRLFWDDKRLRFYEVINGKPYYCGEYDEETLRNSNKLNSESKPSAIQPNINFGNNIPDDSAPF